MQKVKRFKRGLSGSIDRSVHRKWMESRGWRVVREEEVKAYNGGKGCLLFLIFPPLAFLGGSKYIDVTYER